MNILNEKKGNIVYSIIVPIYNEEDNLEIFYGRLTQAMVKLEKNYEIIFVNDGSIDSTPVILKKIYDIDDKVQIINFIMNFGQHQAILAGFEFSTGKIIITIDADLQLPPEEIYKLITTMEEKDCDIVWGYRKIRQSSLFRKTSSKITNMLISSITKKKLHDYGCNFRAYREEIVENLKLFKEKSIYIAVLSSLITNKIIEVEIKEDLRYKGKSAYNLFSLTNLFFNMLTGFSFIPIQFINTIAISFLFLSIILGTYLIIFKPFLGSLFLALLFIITLLFLSSIQLFSLG